MNTQMLYMVKREDAVFSFSTLVEFALVEMDVQEYTEQHVQEFVDQTCEHLHDAYGANFAEYAIEQYPYDAENESYEFRLKTTINGAHVNFNVYVTLKQSMTLEAYESVIYR